MAAIYSVNFWSLQSTPGGDETVYVVPAGFVAIVRDVSIRLVSAPGPTLFVVDISAPVSFITSTPTSTVVVDQWQGRQVFEAGSEIHLASTGGQWQSRASGYLLSV